MSTQFSIGQMNQVADALEAAKYTPEDITQLRSNPEKLVCFRNVLMGLSEVVPIEELVRLRSVFKKFSVVDLDVKPWVPSGYFVEQHVKGGQFAFDAEKVVLYWDDGQLSEDLIVGKELYENLKKKLKDKVLYNANLLDFLLSHSYLIPKDWKLQQVVFWGTIYYNGKGSQLDNGKGSQCVRYLYWHEDMWQWGDYWLGRHFGDHHPTVVSTSN